MSTSNVISSTRMTLCALLVLCACKSTPKEPTTQPAAAVDPNRVERAQITSELTAKAEVVAVNPTTRIIALRSEDGSLFQVMAGQEVRNFGQIAAGDTLRVQYRETLAASIRPASEAAVPVEAGAAAVRAKPGAKPGAGVGAAISLRARVESIDRVRDIVVCSLASGEMFARRVMTPEGREFVKVLKIGDTVQLDYTEAVALSIDKL
jgi:hypothetical protein